MIQSGNMLLSISDLKIFNLHIGKIRMNLLYNILGVILLKGSKASQIKMQRSAQQKFRIIAKKQNIIKYDKDSIILLITSKGLNMIPAPQKKYTQLKKAFS